MRNLFQRLKNRFVAGFIAVTSALGVQYARPPVLEHSPPPIEIQLPSPTPSKETTGEIKFPEYKSGIKLGKISAAQDQINSIINPGHIYADEVWRSDCLEDKIIGAKFTETNGLTNVQILDVVNHSAPTVGVVFFYGTYMQNYVWKTMGYENGDGNVYANSFYIDEPKEFGSLELHEIAHDPLGFRHDGVFATSIPYQFNNFFDECVSK